MAIRAAQEKARLLAGEIGQSIGPAYSITETSGNDYSRSNMVQNAAGIAGDSAASDSAISPGSISVTAQVTVRFRLN